MTVDGLMHEWVAILDEKQQGVMREASVPGSRRLDRQRLEGIAVALMCTADPDVRRQALELLKTLRTLHRSLLASSMLPHRLSSIWILDMQLNSNKT